MRIVVVGAGLGGQDVTLYAMWADPTAQTLTSLAELATSGILRVPVTATYPLVEAPQAFAVFGADALGKLAVACS